MDWHIITSSKGGVGKTLLSLMLLCSHLKSIKDQRRSVLMIDLNGMNPDLLRLMGGKGIDPNRLYTLDAGRVAEKPFPLNFHKVEFKMEPMTYLLGWPIRPYTMLSGAEDFFHFLKTLRDDIGHIQQHFNFKPDTIIVDTNFHFANIFSNDVEVYGRYEIFNPSSDNNFFIWFIWVFAQLNGLLNLEFSGESQETCINAGNALLLDIADKMEERLKNQFLPESPFVHVFNTTTMTSRQTFLEILGVKKDRKFGELQRLLEKRTEGIDRPIKFDQLLANMTASYDPKKMASIPDIHDIFLGILDNYAKKITSVFPVNIIPLPNHHQDLVFYTDEVWRPRGLIDKIEGLEVFNNFRTCLEQMLTKPPG